MIYKEKHWNHRIEMQYCIYAKYVIIVKVLTKMNIF